MRKLLLISLAAVHLLGNTDLGELLKAPRLISHYKEHRKSKPHISFFTFIVMHYINNDDGNPLDDWQDNQLPFHNAKKHHSFSQMFLKSGKAFDIEITPLSEEKVFGGRLLQGYSIEYIFAILHPPQV